MTLIRRPLPVFLFLLSACLVLLFHRSVIDGEIFSPADLIFSFYPWTYDSPRVDASNLVRSDEAVYHQPLMTTHWARLKSGDLPDWDPLTLAGAPAFFQGLNTGLAFSPLSLPFYLLPPDIAVTVYAPLRLFLAGLFMWLFLRRAGLGGAGAAAGGVAYALNGPFITWLSAPMPTVALFLPLALLFAERTARLGRVRDGAALALVVGLQFMGAYLPTSLAVVTVTGAYALWWLLVDRRWRAMPLLAIAALASLAIGAVALTPMFENLATSPAAARSMTFVHLPAGGLVTFALPNFWGNPADHNWWCPAGGNYSEFITYLGITTLAFAAAGFALRCRRPTDLRVLFFGLVGLVVVLLLYGVPPATWIGMLPGFRQMNPMRWNVALAASAAVLAGYGVDALGGMPRRHRDTEDDFSNGPRRHGDTEAHCSHESRVASHVCTAALTMLAGGATPVLLLGVLVAWMVRTDLPVIRSLHLQDYEKAQLARVALLAGASLLLLAATAVIHWRSALPRRHRGTEGNLFDGPQRHAGTESGSNEQRGTSNECQGPEAGGQRPEAGGQGPGARHETRQSVAQGSSPATHVSEPRPDNPKPEARSLRAIAALAVLLIAIDLVSAAWRFNPTIPRDRLYPWTQGLRVLAEQAAQARIAPVGNAEQFVQGHVWSVYGLQTVTGFDFHGDPDYQQFLARASGVAPRPARWDYLEIPPDTRLDLKLLGLLDVRLLVAVPIDAATSRGGFVPVGELTTGRRVTQTFVGRENGLNRVDVLTATYGHRITGTLRLSLLDEATRTPLAERIVRGDVPSNDWLTLAVPEQPQSKGRRYLIDVRALDGRPGEAATVWKSISEGYAGGEMMIDGAPASGDLWFRAFSRAADRWPGTTEIYARDLNIYRNEQARPRAWLVKRAESAPHEQQLDRLASADLDVSETALVDPGQPVPALARAGAVTPKDAGDPDAREFSVRVDPNTVRAGLQPALSQPQRLYDDGTSTAQRGLLVVGERYDAGWQATIDGHPVPLMRADFLLMAVLVPPGTHDVRFEYRRPFLRASILLSGLATLAALGLAVSGRRQRREGRARALRPKV